MLMLFGGALRVLLFLLLHRCHLSEFREHFFLFLIALALLLLLALLALRFLGLLLH